jgi:hypothetical protein
MLLIHLLKILFSVLIIRHFIRWVSYHIHHHNKKERIYHGNTRMPKDVMLALLYGINGKPKIRFKDLSYRKSLAEWWQLINSIYPPDNELSITSQTHTNSNLDPPKLPASITPMRSKMDFKNGNRKQFPFLHSKNISFNTNVISSPLFNTKIISITNLKNYEKPIPSAKPTSACTG